MRKEFLDSKWNIRKAKQHVLRQLMPFDLPGLEGRGEGQGWKRCAQLIYGHVKGRYFAFIWLETGLGVNDHLRYTDENPLRLLGLDGQLQVWQEIVKCMLVPPSFWAPISSDIDTYSENKPKTGAKTWYFAWSTNVELFPNPYSCKMVVYNTCNTEVTDERQTLRPALLLWKFAWSTNVELFSNPYSCKMVVYNTCNTEVTLPNDCCHTSIRQLTRVCPTVWI